MGLFEKEYKLKSTSFLAIRKTQRNDRCLLPDAEKRELYKLLPCLHLPDDANEMKAAELKLLTECLKKVLPHNGHRPDLANWF